jgi:hypothetical protein
MVSKLRASIRAKMLNLDRFVDESRSVVRRKSYKQNTGTMRQKAEGRRQRVKQP